MKLCECGCGQPAPRARKTRTIDGVVKGQLMRFVCGHHMHIKGVSHGASLREQFDARWIPEPNTGCWLWIGTVMPVRGYGRMPDESKRIRFAHRIAWQLYRGPIPEGLVIDHVCRVRSCVNPDHLRLVTIGQNVLENSVGLAAQNAAKTHCKHGHEFTTENTKIDKRNRYGREWIGRSCRTCARGYQSIINRRNAAKKRVS